MAQMMGAAAYSAAPADIHHQHHPATHPAGNFGTGHRFQGLGLAQAERGQHPAPRTARHQQPT